MLWRVYFEMFHGTFLLFHIHIEQFSVISIRHFILLLLLLQLIPICPRNWDRVPATKPLAPISIALTVTVEYNESKYRCSKQCQETCFSCPFTNKGKQNLFSHFTAKSDSFNNNVHFLILSLKFLFYALKPNFTTILICFLQLFL